MRRFAALLLFFYAAFLPAGGFAFTLDELIVKAKENHNVLKGQRHKKDAQFLRYKASFDPYYPSLDVSMNYNKYYDSELNPAAKDKEYYAAGATLGYKLFDPKRSSGNTAQSYAFQSEETTYFTLEKDLLKYVKDLFYKILAQKMIYESREEAYNAAKRTHELAQAKRDVGIAKVSEVYEAKVRMENARMETVTTRNALNKLIYELSSITVIALSRDDFKEPLAGFIFPIKDEALFKIALERRDEIKSEEFLQKKLEEDRKTVKGDFWPQANLSLSYKRFEGAFFPSPDETRLDMSLSWNLFSGPGKFYRSNAAGNDITLQKYKIEELKRTILLDVKKSFEDINTNAEQLNVSEEILKSAQQTYDQTFEEYRVGKGNILNLLQAEINLSAAREGKINALLSLYLSKNAMERTLGINDLRELR